ncbi:MAG TPA: TlpA disulfide reductase family protein [Candidatus Competibacteraceae bacterium]|nr:TlpA disulfide reductase family protein [Candidatus Competibacteraceae bacterium]
MTKSLHYLLSLRRWRPILLFLLAFLSSWAGLSLLPAMAQSASKSSLPAPLAERPPAPDFKLIDTQSKAHSLSDYRGKVVLLNFWATWCEPCRKEMPALQRAWEYLRPKGGMVLAINIGDSGSVIDQFLKEVPVNFPVLLSVDDDLLTQWSVKGLPMTFIIDPQGRIAYRIPGDLEWDQTQLLDQILALQESK